MGALLVLALVFHWRRLGEIFTLQKETLAYLGPVLIVLVYLLSGINTEDHAHWLKQVRIKLPFLLLPLAFYILRKEATVLGHKWLHYTLAGVGLLSTVPVLYHYYTHKEALIAAIGHGHYIPTPIDHIHYSIILAYASLSMVLIFLQDRYRQSTAEKAVSLGVAALIAAVLHILAVRSGLAILYIGLGAITVWYVVQQRRLLLGLGAITMLALLPFLAYKTVPSLQKKISYMVYDFQQYQKGEGNNYSDSERLMSYKIALDLAKEQPIVGHGVGDLRQLMIERHQALYGQKEKYIFPHNQYLYVLSGSGILGFLTFFLGLLSPLLFGHRRPFLVLIFIVMLASFMVENTLQRAVSIAFFMLFIYWNLMVEESTASQ